MLEAHWDEERTVLKGLRGRCRVRHSESEPRAYQAVLSVICGLLSTVSMSTLLEEDAEAASCRIASGHELWAPEMSS